VDAPRADALPDPAIGLDPAAAAIELIRSFRAHFGRLGHRERGRLPLVSRHDPSIRFTNSTISVFKAELLEPEPALLVQPALRLRNLTHWQRHGSVSGFGCYFVALGTLAPPGSLPAVQESVITWLRDGLGVAERRMVIRGSSLDPDLVGAAEATGVDVEVDGYDQHRYRHAFGLDGIRGRNTNLSLRTTSGLLDICNVIVIEREDGTPLAVETAFGVNTVLARIHDLRHVLLASAAASGAPEPVDLMAVDAAGSAVALLSEGLRTLLTVFADRVSALGLSQLDAQVWLGNAVAAEYGVREAMSPPGPETVAVAQSAVLAELADCLSAAADPPGDDMRPPRGITGPFPSR